jgi:hypothetical protein
MIKRSDLLNEGKIVNNRSNSGFIQRLIW